MAATTRRPWDQADIDQLRRLVAARTPTPDICTQLGRTLKAVQLQASREQIPVPRATFTPREQLTRSQLFILSRLSEEDRPLAIVDGSPVTVPAQFPGGEWGIATRRNAIDALVRRGFITRVGSDRYTLTEGGAAAMTRCSPHGRMRFRTDR